MSDLRPGQEHYQGCVVRTDDGNVYAIAGHNHISVVRVEGLEQAQRINGELTVRIVKASTAQFSCPSDGLRL